MKRRITSILLPPLIGSLLLTLIAFYEEKQQNYGDVALCDTFVLSYPDYLVLWMVLTAIGGLVQVGLVNPANKIFAVNSIGRWFLLGAVLTLALGVGFAFLLWSEKLELPSLVSSLFIGCSIAAAYVIGNLLTLRILHSRGF